MNEDQTGSSKKESKVGPSRSRRRVPTLTHGNDELPFLREASLRRGLFLSLSLLSAVESQIGKRCATVSAAL
eukprot:1183344-Prorocentrum_minimum.AAC.1